MLIDGLDEEQIKNKLDLCQKELDFVTISKIQKAFLVSFNEASSIIDYGISQGFFVKEAVSNKDAVCFEKYFFVGNS